MKVEYNIDLSNFSLERFKGLIENREMLPSRKMLQEKLEDRFAVLKSQGISNLKELVDALKTREKIEKFTKQTNLPVDYLTILKREASSYVSSPVKLKDFPGINTDYLNKLTELKMSNSKQLFDNAQTEAERKAISESTGIPMDKIKELFCLSDLVRIWGVGAVFARIIYEAGIKSTKQFAESDAEQAYNEYVRINEEKGFTAAKFIQKDIEFCIELAKELEFVTEY